MDGGDAEVSDFASYAIGQLDEGGLAGAVDVDVDVGRGV
jgi:hypothetical protein